MRSLTAREITGQCENKQKTWRMLTNHIKVLKNIHAIQTRLKVSFKFKSPTIIAFFVSFWPVCVFIWIFRCHKDSPRVSVNCKDSKIDPQFVALISWDSIFGLPFNFGPRKIIQLMLPRAHKLQKCTRLHDENHRALTWLSFSHSQLSGASKTSLWYLEGVGNLKLFP